MLRPSLYSLNVSIASYFLGNVYYTQRTVWTTIAIIFAVILPILLFLTCIVYWWRKKHIQEDPNWKMPIPSRSASRSTLRNLGSERDDNTIEKVRNYDGSYKTHEPLENRPAVDFQDKKLDLDEEDILSSEDGSEYKDKVAKDFEYRTQDGGQSRQLGRRAQRQAAIQEEDDPQNTYQPASPVDSPPPQVNYSSYPSTSYGASPGGLNYATSPEQSPPQIRNLVITNPSGTFYRSAPTSPPLSQNVGLPSSPTNDSRSTQV